MDKLTILPDKVLDIQPSEVWSQAFSADEGKTWEWNWYMYFKRLKRLNAAAMVFFI